MRFQQAIKTAIAGVVCIYVTRFLHLPEGYWAAISAFIVIQSNVGATVRASWNRLAGTAIGAAVGGTLVQVWGANVLAFGIATLAAILLCRLLNLHNAYRLASVTVAIVMMVGRPAAPWFIAFHRFLEVSLGIVIALIITVVIWPSRARRRLRQGIAQALTGLDALFQAVIQRYRNDPAATVEELRRSLGDTLRANEDLLRQTKYEPATGPEDRELLVLLLDHTRRILQAVEALELVTRESAGDAYHRSFEPDLGRLITTISAALRRLAGNVEAWRFDAPPSGLAAGVSSLDEKAAHMRRQRASASYELEEVLRFYAFSLSLRNLARELDLAFATMFQDAA